MQVLLNNRKIAARETWLVLEFCNQGTLSYAIERGKFDRGFIENGKHDRRPHIPSIKCAPPCKHIVLSCNNLHQLWAWVSSSILAARWRSTFAFQLQDFVGHYPCWTYMEETSHEVPLACSYPWMRFDRQTARELASAMCYLHGRGMLHGDLNGCNVLLSSTSRDARGFTVKVADFGLARRCTEAPIRTSTYGTVGG